jgi:serine/threonine protein kinase
VDGRSSTGCAGGRPVGAARTGCLPTPDEAVCWQVVTASGAEPPPGARSRPAAPPSVPDQLRDPLRDQLQATLGAAYTLERELGGGGMSRVFLAEETRFRRRVVLKVLAPELARGLSAERFEREIGLAAALQEPHIVPVLSAGDVDGLPWYSMPFVAGESLRERLRRGPVPAGEAVAILRDVARALAYAHAQGVVHRDIKPGNVLLHEGTAVVADFGIAKALQQARPVPPDGPAAPADGLTQAGTPLGTPAYMAPEQAAGDPRRTTGPTCTPGASSRTSCSPVGTRSPAGRPRTR